MIGVIYARYSSDNQRDESIDGQVRECMAFAKKNDIQIIETYITFKDLEKSGLGSDLTAFAHQNQGFDIFLISKPF